MIIEVLAQAQPIHCGGSFAVLISFSWQNFSHSQSMQLESWCQFEKQSKARVLHS